MAIKGIFLTLLRRPIFWKLIRPLLRLYVSKERNKPFTIWVDFLAETMESLWRRSKPIIWINSFFPVEMIYSLGGQPFLPELFPAVVAYFDWTRGPLLRGSEKTSTDLCSFYRCALGLLEYGVIPKPDLIVTSSQICDGTKAFYDALSYVLGVPHVFIDVPHADGEKAKVYLRKQLLEFLETYQERFGGSFNPLPLFNAQRAGNLMWEIAELRKAVPTPFPGTEGMSYVAGMAFWANGTKKYLKFLKALKEKIKAKVDRSQGYLPKERFRVLWLHHIRPYYPNPIFEYLHSRGVAIAYEEVNYPWWPRGHFENWMEYVIEKMISNPWHGPIQKRAKLVEELIEGYKVHGVIHFCHWGCRQSTGGAGIIGEFVKKKGIPYLLLPGDGVDPDNYSPGQTLTRLEAFVEVMESKWKGGQV